MARNGSGTMQPVTNSWNPQINGVNANGPDFNQLYFDLINALTQSISADGQTPITGNLQMGNNKLTGLAAGTGSGDSLRWQQLFDQGIETDVASAATTDIGIQNSNFIRVTGTTAITSFGTTYRGPRFIRFAASLTLTHNPTTLILPAGVNITTAANDVAIAYPVGNPASGWIVAAYRPAAQGAGPFLSLSGGSMAGSINESRAIVASAATTSDIWSALGNSIEYTGSAAVTNFPAAPQAGAKRWLHCSAGITFTNNANIAVQGNASYSTNAGDVILIEAITTTTFRATIFKADGLPVSLRSYISGLIMSTAGSSSSISISAGVATSSDESAFMKIPTAIAKTTAAWAAGNGNGGKLSAAAIAPSTMYYFYAIYRPDTGAVDIGFDVSSAAPTLPANYTKSRYIGAWPTDGSSNWLPMTQVGGDFYYKTPVSDVNGVASSTTAVLVSMSVPRGRKVKLYFNAAMSGTAGNTSSYISDPDNADIGPAIGANPAAHVQSQTSMSGQVWTDTLGRIRHRESFNVLTLSILTLGWYDPRGKE